ncbi:RDD family protein [Streptomonospora litoralis]|uniref:RDD family protein n=1 Tax=Streptomonospora litoralis TaxID=2498135 RepID=A0A4V0ZJQ2_9ACTN|nr:RDD family protein [Streptomonospora litoralis]QBI54272.1 RDD family protein [Streptomonospora litoralis]
MPEPEDPRHPGGGPYPPPSAPDAPRSRPADPGRRMLAFAVDLVLTLVLFYVLFLLGMAASYGVVTGLGLPDNLVSVSVSATVVVAADAAALVCYHWLPLARRGQTLGKRLFGMRVVAADTGHLATTGRAAARAALHLLLLVPCLLGQVASGILLLTDEPVRRSALDRMTKTRVVEV